ncbi:MAG: hypothetical protein ACOH2E_06405 [Candidatus Paracaedibacter sp.]
MRFDRGLRNAMVKPYPLGHASASTAGFNEEDPRCIVGGVKDAGLWLNGQDLPSSIELQVRLTPVWVENGAATAKLADNKPCPLYPPRSIFSKVNVTTMGFGQYQKASGEEKVSFVGTSFLQYSLEMSHPFVFQKTFLVQPEGRSIHWTPQGVPFFWAYGGAQMGDDIHPLVVTLETMRGETTLHPLSLLSLGEQGIFPPKGREGKNEEVSFQDVFEEDQTRTFVESIEKGMAHINLIIGVDETGKPVKIPYHSYRLANGSLYYKKGE